MRELHNWRWSPERLVRVAVAIGFAVWSGVFIFGSSGPTIGHGRSFSLFDDAMISMRYAWNFSHGYGLVWNKGEYVQGYTNLLMTLLMSLATFIFSKTIAVLAVQILGVIFMLLIATLNMRLADLFFDRIEGNLRSFIRVLSFASGFVYYPLVYWSIMGMETGLLTVLLLAALLMTVGYARSGGNWRLVWATVYFGLSFLTRNDSIIFFFLGWFYLLLKSRQATTRVNPRWLVSTAGVYLLIVASQLVFQRLYYGQFLPNTYTLKLTGMPILLRLQNGIGFVVPFLGETALILALAVISVLWSYQPEKLLLLMMMAASVAYQVYIGGDPWAYWRMMSPAVLPMLILAMDALLLLGNRLWGGLLGRHFQARGQAKVRNIFLAAFVLVLYFGAITKADWRFWPELAFEKLAFDVKANQESVKTAGMLNDLLNKSATIGVFRAGTIPYYTDFRAIDFLGKSDRYIAQLPPDLSGRISGSGMNSIPGHNKYDLVYSIMLLKPTYVQQLHWGGEDVSKWAEGIYIPENYRGAVLYLLRNSPDVKWNVLGSQGAYDPARYRRFGP